MTMRNVSIVFSLTLRIPATVFNLLMSEFEYIFWTTEDGDAAPRMIEDDDQEDAPNNSIEEYDRDSSNSNKQPIPEQARQPPPSIRIERKATLRLREEFGRSNRNSVHYMDGAPNAIVSIEKSMNGKFLFFYTSTIFGCNEYCSLKITCSLLTIYKNNILFI